jgi:sigma-B regulation protein RsbU (phosphoserine phosphatase)
LLLRRDGSLVRLEPVGAVLGPFPNWNYKSEEIALETGDRLLLFTDGVTELRNAAADEFGEERLIDLLIKNRDLEAEALRDLIVLEVTKFADEDFQDDATLLVMSM